MPSDNSHSSWDYFPKFRSFKLPPGKAFDLLAMTTMRCSVCYRNSRFPVKPPASVFPLVSWDSASPLWTHASQPPSATKHIRRTCRSSECRNPRPSKSRSECVALRSPSFLRNQSLVVRRWLAAHHLHSHASHFLRCYQLRNDVLSSSRKRVQKDCLSFS